ncbi:BZ3500_MvSof-1268-A1-R1_Chr2-1g04487 [Microbotryum saponariae]|uniref:BZ3500_MvSof-1268-A1-R1_Chr2-1g04487 protein n=1 Tax=Microbotryum saponariae TaxID=289078 RepID=A0A2X0MBN5_9BASI|nr:BZ3500_MvSof-1268-A1-R1_Chr2-1g04487 [Microbotryum saponariae]SCZ91822.1 BZ3501_MvSof-1269-A2-R1_Chr2-1g04143 [Microbotryum saponariae]
MAALGSPCYPAIRWCRNRTFSFAQPAGIGPCLRPTRQPRGLDHAHTSPTISAVRQSVSCQENVPI